MVLQRSHEGATVVNLLPAGNVSEVLAGGGVDRADIHKFLRLSHHTASINGVSYVAIGVLPDGGVWLLTDADPEQLNSALREADAVDAEVLKLENLN